MVNAANMAAVAKSASSSTIIADLPPSSRKTFLTVSLAAAMIRRPVGVEPVKVTMSTSGLGGQHARRPRVRDDVSTLTTPAGMSVCSAISSPSASVISGVSGAPLSTTVQPAASAGASLASASWFG